MSIAEIFESLEYGPAPESASPAVRWLDAHGRRTGLYVDGAWREPADGETFDTVNPATNQPLAAVAQAGKADVDAAVEAARRALPGWQALGGHGRARYLYAIARLVQKHSRLFAVLESMDNGKPIRAWCRSTRACSRCWSRWTTASRSASRATSTSRWWPGTSTTTPGGRSSWRPTPSCATPWRSASWDR
jgi:acyl-CoA reductase-like NAD-dependent aldehyde dehydrogenase